MSTDGAGVVGTEPSAPSLDGGGGASLPVRAQILATEHWSLLAQRGTTWSEVMSRITIYLTVLSASLLVVALVAQTSGFGTAFNVASIGLASAVLVLGTLTGIRVTNASQDDYAMVVGMNRLRAAYVAIDPSIEPYLVASRYDDRQGVMGTYALGQRRNTVVHIVGSTNFFVSAVNAIVAGTLGALVTNAAGGATWLVAVVGSVCGLGYLGAQIAYAGRQFRDESLEPRFPTPR
jgi:hypothetical protein